MKDYPTDDILYKLIKSGTKGAIGLPLNVQVIGKPWHEEGVLRIMKELEESANYSSLKS
jgi:Asp-tRNA(Asn)/Glu-tRNA(Gln) amidotransferase A subunit family amidase